MYTRTIFGDIKSSDGYTIQTYGKNAVRLKKGKQRYFVFFEYLQTKPLSVQVDQSRASMDEKFINLVADSNLRDELISRTIGYFEFRGIPVDN